MAQEEFIRVGTTLYKIVNQPRINGGFVKKRIVWNNETLRQDYGKDFIATVPKYDGFCTVPNHVAYQPVVDKFLNLYEPIEHQPKEGEFPHVESLIRHIFGEQYELGGHGLLAVALSPTRAETPHPPDGVRRTQYRQEYVPKLSQIRFSEQRNLQYQRRLPQSIQCGLGR